MKNFFLHKSNPSSVPSKLRSVVAVACVALLFVGTSANAQRYATELGIERMEETLQPKVEEGSLSVQGIGPVLLVGATSAYEETRAWFPTAALESMIRVFGNGNVRACEACMNPMVRVEKQRLEYNTVLSLADIARLDAEMRGNGPPARAAVWLEETPAGVAIRIISIDNGQVLYAGNFDRLQKERERTAKSYNLSLDLGRRLRGESLTHIFIDFGLLPNQHWSADIVEQFGPYNLNLAGLTLSLIDPLGGMGLSYYRVIPQLWDLTLGVQAIVSLLTAAGYALSPDNPQDLIDPLLTGVLVARWPIPSTNFAVLATASTNFNFTIGVSMMNVSFMPFLP
ncbi:MAG: hypothetical protein GY822_11450 [Deltaproteobacteria bacterium]|nr:hypothetical protein [Deltaproteobacteria bacterium]